MTSNVDRPHQELGTHLERHMKLLRTLAIAAALAALPAMAAAPVAAQSDFGFTGQWTETVLPIPLAEDSPVKANGDGPVAAQTIAMSSLEPGDTDFECFNFFEDFFFGPDERWVAFIVGNLGDTTVRGEVIIRVRGPERDTIEREVVLQPESAQLFKAEITLPDRAGLYRLIGKFKPEDRVNGPKTAKGAFIIPESAL